MFSNPVTVIRVIVMIIGGIIAIIGMNKHKQGAGWGQPLAVIGAIVAIIAALSLYLDFVNLFLYILRFTGRRK